MFERIPQKNSMTKISSPRIRRQNEDPSEDVIVILNQFEIETLLCKLLSEFKSVGYRGLTRYYLFMLIIGRKAYKRQNYPRI